ncbi:MAG: N-acetyltransferase [Novosphingobium sp.]|nr:N-acetyltransferase [Novosphingobium sp.]
MRDLVADPQVCRYLGPRADDPTTDMFSRALRAAGSWQLYGYGMFLVWEKSSGAFVGQAGAFHSMRGFGKGLDDVPEAGWIIARAFWGKGYAFEAMRAALAWYDADVLRADAGRCRIACMIERGNEASVRLAERLGFSRYDEHTLSDGAEVDLFERGGAIRD